MTVRCEKCGGRSGVTQTRSVGKTARRRRKCSSCGFMWTTYEFTKTPVQFRGFQRQIRDAIATLQAIELSAADE